MRPSPCYTAYYVVPNNNNKNQKRSKSSQGRSKAAADMARMSAERKRANRTLEELQRKLKLARQVHAQARRRTGKQLVPRAAASRPQSRAQGARGGEQRTKQFHAWLRSPEYNKAFAGGHHHLNLVPRPAQGPDKQPRTYRSAVGSTNSVIQIQGDSMAIVAFNPYAQEPIAILTMPRVTALTFQLTAGATQADTNDWAEWTLNDNGSAPVSTVNINNFVDTVPWVGITDPRTLVSGFEGPKASEIDPLTNGYTILQQYMGGSIELSMAAGYNTTAKAGVIDSHSYATSWGVAQAPQTTVGYNIGNLVPQNVPDSEDTFQWFLPAASFGSQPCWDLDSSMQSVSFIGASNQTQHLGFNLPPVGTRWAPWGGAYLPTVPGTPVAIPAYNNATQGAVPYRSWLAMLASGYPLIVLYNTGSAEASPVTITMRSKLYYNVQIPTSGARAIRVLADSSPVTVGHNSTVGTIHSVPVFSDQSLDDSKAKTAHASRLSSAKKGEPDVVNKITAAPHISIGIAADVPNVASPNLPTLEEAQQHHALSAPSRTNKPSGAPTGIGDVESMIHAATSILDSGSGSGGSGGMGEMGGLAETIGDFLPLASLF